MRRNSGFTLIEILVTVTIAAVLLGVGIPSFASLVKNNRRTTVINHLVTDIHKARSESFARNERAVICRGNGNPAAPACASGGTEWAQGWLVFLDADQDGDFDAGADELIGFGDAMPAAINLYSNTALYAFTRFSSSASGTFQVCIDDDPDAAKAVIVDRGRPRLAKDDSGLDCQ